MTRWVLPTRATHIIINTSQDFFQTLRPNVRLLRARRRAAETPGARYQAFGLAEFREHFPGLQPTQWVDYLALRGDAVDNVPGVRVLQQHTTATWVLQPTRTQGIGDKSALQVLQVHGNLDDVFANMDDQALPKRARSALARPGAEAAARLSKRLVQLQVGLELPQLQFEVEDLAIQRHKEGCDMVCSMLEQRWDMGHLSTTIQNTFA